MFASFAFLAPTPKNRAETAPNRYLLGRLKTLCEEAIRKSITIDTVCTIFLLAHKHNAEGLKVRPLGLLKPIQTFYFLFFSPEPCL